MSISTKQLARMLQNRATAIKAVQAVSAIQDDIAAGDGHCFYVHDNDGGIIRVALSQYKQPLR